jgi:hypothetical protein
MMQAASSACHKTSTTDYINISKQQARNRIKGWHLSTVHTSQAHAAPAPRLHEAKHNPRTPNYTSNT